MAPNNKIKKKVPTKSLTVRKSMPKKLTFDQRVEVFSTKLTEWIGSNTSLLIHTIVFAGSFAFYFFGAPIEQVLLILTTVVSLEAIYLAIFIQISVNKNTKSLREVERDIDEIQEDVEEIQEDVEEIQEDVEEIQEDVEEIEKDVDSIEKDVDELQEDVEEINEEEETEEQKEKTLQLKLDTLQWQLQDVIEQLRNIDKKK